MQTQNQTRVPPPPAPEVMVRTLRSDSQSISQGEITPKPELVATVGDRAITETVGPAKKKQGLKIALILIAVLALVAIGYFAASSFITAPAPTVLPAPTP